VVIRHEDTLQDLKEKIRIATIMGTYQSMLVDFRYVRNIWKKNQEEERLLGVSLTGIMDHPVLSQVSDEAISWLKEMKLQAIETNKEWATKLGINQSVAITTVKPSGTVSQLVDSSSGKHERYSEFYVRTVRADKKDPLAQLMRKQGFPVEDCLDKPHSTDIFSFPVKAPPGSILRNDRTAIQQLEHHLMFQKHWSEHNVSNTIYVRDHEWLAVGDWVYQNFAHLAGVSFLPHSDHAYRQAPYTECTEQEYNELLAKMPNFDWAELAKFEQDDTTVNTRELACSSGVCEIL
jgi:ribonucleoside-diphosphate reductase alpha chain